MWQKSLKLKLKFVNLRQFHNIGIIVGENSRDKNIDRHKTNIWNSLKIFKI